MQCVGCRLAGPVKGVFVGRGEGIRQSPDSITSTGMMVSMRSLNCYLTVPPLLMISSVGENDPSAFTRTGWTQCCSARTRAANGGRSNGRNCKCRPIVQFIVSPPKTAYA